MTMIVDFYSDSPAEAAGLSSGSRFVRIGPYVLPTDGDIITAIDGQAVKSMDDLTIYLELNKAVGDTVSLTYQRNGVENTTAVPLSARPQSGN